MERKPLKYSYWIAILSLVAIGFSFIGLRLATGPGELNLGSIIPWGLGVSFYIFFIGLSAGAFLISSLIYAFNIRRYERVGRLALFSALSCLVVALLMIAFDLGHTERFWEIFANFAKTSVIWWMIMIMLFYIVLLLAELYFAMRTDLIGLRERSTAVKRRLYSILTLGSRRVDQVSKDRDRKFIRVLAIIGIPTALALHGGTGAAFGVMKAVPYWYSALTPILFITSALVSGAALILFARAFFFRPEEGETEFLSNLGKLILLLLFIDWVLLFAEFLIGVYGSIPMHLQAIENMVFGSHWWVFWFLQFGIGVLAPVFLILSKWTRKSTLWLGLAGLAIVLGIVAMRWNFVVPPLSIPMLEGMPEAFFSARLTTLYSPSLGEWLSNVGLFALWFLFLSAGKALLPLGQPVGHLAHTGHGGDQL